MSAVEPIAIISTGMVTPVGLDALSSCAAMRCGLAAFEETRFIGKSGNWLIAAEAQLEEPWRGHAKLVKMAARAWRECVAQRPTKTADMPPTFLCVAEPARPGRSDDHGARLYFDLQRELSLRFPAASRVIEGGRAGAAAGLHAARQFLYQSDIPGVILLGVDSFLNAQTLAAYDQDDRLLADDNSNGFIPGEAAAALYLTRGDKASHPSLTITGMGFANEKATVASGEPLRADGMRSAFLQALEEAGIAMHDIHYRMTDIAGEQYYFKEAALALTRTLRQRVENMDIEHPAESIGEAGAAALPVMLGATLMAQQKGYAQGTSVLAHLSGDEGKRAAIVLHYQGTEGEQKRVADVE